MPSTTATHAVDTLDDFLPIPTNTLIPDQSVGVELYIRESSESPLRLYRGHNIPFELNDRQRLAERGVRMLFIRKSAHRQYQDYLRENLANVLDDEQESVTSRFTALSEVVRDIMASSFRKGDVNETVQQSGELADHCVKLLQRDDYAATDLMGVLHHDYHTFTHSANVAFLCVMLARELGITDPSDIRQIAVGALLHDLGKLEIPDAILTKPGKLTGLEYDVIQDHARFGFRKLCQREDITFAQLMMVYQHHERVDGGGYPVGCPRSNIHEWARICTVVDVYEALTANRPYRRPLPRADVIAILERGCGTLFDPEMLKCWLTVIKHK